MASPSTWFCWCVKHCVCLIALAESLFSRSQQEVANRESRTLIVELDDVDVVSQLQC